ncbi:hypothetical protein C6501_09390 [Candidatus Poribacteria bacterium]|nr:MAG: hypothetical protein C6501_09390 [Candidatus Poribacteria bacterium]
MRAVVLSDNQIIEFLNENFINTWVTNAELGRTPSLREPIAKRREREGKTLNTTYPLAQAIMEGWTEGSPVDCLVISPEFDVMGKLPLNDFFDDCYQKGISEEDGYLMFLMDSLDAKFPGFGENISEPLLTGANITLNKEHFEQEVLHILRAPGYGEQDYNVITIDTIAFKDGGVLMIDIRMGSAKSGGSFDLFDGDTELPTRGIPTEARASVWDIPSGQIGKIQYPFNEGKIFKLGATGTWFSGKGNVNAFYAKISVEAVEKNEN